MTKRATKLITLLTEATRFATFVLTGGLAAGVNLISRWLLSHVVLYEVAVTLAYLVGMITAYLLARSFVFTSEDGNRWREFGRFAAVNVVSLLIVLGVSVGLARLLFPSIRFEWHAEDIAHLIGVASPIAVSYFAHKHYSFAGGRHLS